MHPRPVPSPVRSITTALAAAAPPAALALALAIGPVAAPAAALERHLPPEDRAALAVLADGGEGRADVLAEDLRLFDLLPPVEDEGTDDEGAEAPDAAEDAEAARDVVHVLAAGETLADVAELHGVEDGDADGWRRLFDANPDIADPDLIEVGTRVRIPGPGEDLERRALPAPPRPEPATARSGGSSGSSGGAGVWDRLAACEANGNWAANTGNGYYGGLQFSPRSWQAVGGTGLPHEHSRATQIAMGERLRAAQGWGAWPACSRKLGLR